LFSWGAEKPDGILSVYSSRFDENKVNNRVECEAFEKYYPTPFGWCVLHSIVRGALCAEYA